MSDFEPRLIGIRILNFVVVLAAIIMAIVCIIGLGTGSNSSARSVAVIISMVGLILVAAIYCTNRILISLGINTMQISNDQERISRHISKLESQIDQLNESMLLSEDAKLIAFRDKDRQALRQAIDEEINNKDWESANYLVEQMEKRFGYQKEAREYRQKLHEIQQKQLQEALETETSKFEELLNSHRWQEAANLIERIRTKFPNTPQAEELENRLEESKVMHKKHLLQEWDKAVQQDEFDRGINILRELDAYLSKSEVAALEESARGVFRAKLHNLGMQFSLLVTEKVWDKAYEVATEIVREFPNSRMAAEIRERLSALKTRMEEMQKKGSS